MKIHMSEELHYDELEINDGSEAKEDAEKVAEKGEKEVQKEIDKRIDDVEDINEFEPDELKLKTVDNKNFKPDNSKVKELKEEKLTLNEDDDLEEAIPKDLVKAYKRAYRSYQGDPNADLQKATYTEVTPDEAYNIVKKQDKEGALRLIVNGRLIKIRNGYGDRDYSFRSQNVGGDKAYIRKSGAREYDTAKMGLKHLLQIADKIYYTNEAEPEGQKDQAMLQQRRQNPESRYFSGSLPGPSHGGRGKSYRSWYNYSNKEVDAARRNIYKEYTDKKALAKQKLDAGDMTQDQYDKYIADIKSDLAHELENNYKISDGNERKDYIARKRYADAERAIRAPMDKYDELKDDINNAQANVNNYTDKLNRVKSQGSYKTRQAKQDISYYQRQLSSLAQKLAELEMQLETADEDDQAEMNELQKTIDDNVAKLDSYRDEIKKLLRKTEGLDDLYDKIEGDEDLTEEFEDILDTLYPEGFDAEKVVDTLKNREMVSEMLDLEDRNE